MSADNQTFAYGGFEVDLSVWDAEKAFSASTSPEILPTENGTGKKRKRETLFPGEIWRAKNVNGFLRSLA